MFEITPKTTVYYGNVTKFDRTSKCVSLEYADESPVTLSLSEKVYESMKKCRYIDTSFIIVVTNDNVVTQFKFLRSELKFSRESIIFGNLTKVVTKDGVTSGLVKVDEWNYTTRKTQTEWKMIKFFNSDKECLADEAWYFFGYGEGEYSKQGVFRCKKASEGDYYICKDYRFVK